MQNTAILRRPRVTNLAEIIKTTITFIKITFKFNKSQIANYVLKDITKIANSYVKNAAVNKTQVASHRFDSSWSITKCHHCGICMKILIRQPHKNLFWVDLTDLNVIVKVMIKSFWQIYGHYKTRIICKHRRIQYTTKLFCPMFFSTLQSSIPDKIFETK